LSLELLDGDSGALGEEEDVPVLVTHADGGDDMSRDALEADLADAPTWIPWKEDVEVSRC
jgi:hypothetical protein